MTDRDAIHIQGLAVDCIVGVLAEERDHEQPVLIDLELRLDLAPAARSGRIGDTCDYDRVSAEVATLMRFRRYRLLEMAVEEVAAMLLGVHPPLSTVRLRLEKPRALEGRARAAAVEIVRARADFARRTEPARFGEVEVLHENREAGLYLLHVDPGQQIPDHHHRVMRELEWLVAGDLLRDERPIGAWDPVVWPHGKIHGYRNQSGHRATLFCCDCPPFFADDEIEAIVTGGNRR